MYLPLPYNIKQLEVTAVVIRTEIELNWLLPEFRHLNQLHWAVGLSFWWVVFWMFGWYIWVLDSVCFFIVILTLIFFVNLFLFLVWFLLLLWALALGILSLEGCRKKQTEGISELYECSHQGHKSDFFTSLVRLMLNTKGPDFLWFLYLHWAVLCRFAADGIHPPYWTIALLLPPNEGQL